MKAKTEMRIDKETLNLRTMGISNWVLDKINNRKYSVQFYDYDHDIIVRDSEVFRRIMEIFPYDCILYKTKHGTQFISFSLLHGLRYTRAKAVETSKEIGDQDYWSEGKDLTLRVSEKWNSKRKGVSDKPMFKGIVKAPDKHIISQNHLKFYLNYMNLPIEVYHMYDACDKRDYRIKIYHYKTRD